MNNNEYLHFTVDSGLKRVLGSDLITNDEVAIFELVKNSFDAHATIVYIYFSDNDIIIVDNGHGMNKEDILHKWLRVAYSEKNHIHDIEKKDTIYNKRYYAGSKGIGRFSLDRLGEVVELQTKHERDETSVVHTLLIDWRKFENNMQSDFITIPIEYTTHNSFNSPTVIPKFKHGTVISIMNTKQNWERDKILKLKSGLTKLINPFGDKRNKFSIIIIAPKEQLKDEDFINKQGPSIDVDYGIVNGEINNFIFNTLKNKTTCIEVSLDKDTNILSTKLTDRGELIYHIRENNPYDSLRISAFECTLYFLNRSAKSTFTRRMGIPPVQFGSVFLFRNGFRVYPIGEQSNDWFRIDVRKQQGYKRFLGTRDVIGRIDVIDENNIFTEPSSRNTGLISTKETEDLINLFRTHCLFRLESYIVAVTFPVSADKDSDDISNLLTDQGRASVIKIITKLIDQKDVELLAYSNKFITTINSNIKDSELIFNALKHIAEKSNNSELLRNIEIIQNDLKTALQEKENAVKAAELLEKEMVKSKKSEQLAIAKSERVSKELDEEKQKNLFLVSVASLDEETVINLHHQINIYADNIQQYIRNYINKMLRNYEPNKNNILDLLDKITLMNSKILEISKFASRANFKMQAEYTDAVVADYIESYVNTIGKKFTGHGCKINVTNDNKGKSMRFKPIDISIIIDNLISNSKKAKAENIYIDMTHNAKGQLTILFSDNGIGFKNYFSNVENIFEKGITTTKGSGLGLYHVRQVLNEMNGTIDIDLPSENTTFIIRIN